MTIDASLLGSLLIGLAALVGWLVKQANEASKAQRADLRRLRSGDLARRRYIHRLEAALADRDLDLPDKPEGYPETGEE